MEECLTCKCGGQSWTLYNNRIECNNSDCDYVLKFGAIRIDVNGLNKGLKKTKK
jgi:hypothetical protein